MKKVPKEQEDAIVEVYLNGATQEEAAALFGYHQTTCLRILKERGITPRKGQGGRRVPKEHEDEMIKAYLAGATQKEAASLFGYDKMTCSDVLKRQGIIARERGIPKEQEDIIIEAYLSGATQEEAAALFGYHKTTCANILKRRDIPLRSLSEALRIPKEHEDGMIEAYLRGVSAEQAAAQFGYTGMACFNALKRRGITSRKVGIPQEHGEAIIAAYLAGATQQEAAALFGYSGNACLNALRRRGITPRSHMEVLRIPQEQEEAIIAAYQNGATLAESAALFGYSGNVCLNALRRRGITPRSHAEVCRIPKEHENTIVEAYLMGASMNEAVSLFGYDGQTCANVLKRRGIVPRKHAEVCRRYAVNEHFFDCIDTEEKAYWLGFITADGGIVDGAIVLAVNGRDASHLHKFATSLDAEHPVIVRKHEGYKGQLVARLVVHSVKLVQALSLLGVGENKSFTVRPCVYVPDTFLKAYWRGVFDGDGCIARSGLYWSISLVGNQAIVTGFHDFMNSFVSSKANVRPHRSIFIVGYKGLTLPKEVACVLYDRATVYLDRKYNLAKELCKDLL